RLVLLAAHFHAAGTVRSGPYQVTGQQESAVMLREYGRGRGRLAIAVSAPTPDVERAEVPGVGARPARASVVASDPEVSIGRDGRRMRLSVDTSVPDGSSKHVWLDL